jgi:serine kinase of HPr protein (carbohydrate metabolism regulator)
MLPGMETVWGTTVAIDGRAVLLRGPSGAGKSDVALRLIDGGAVLVSDDRTELVREGDRLVARAPEALRNRMEVRGVGIVTIPAVVRAPLVLAVDLVPPEQVPRLPDPGRWTHSGVSLPLIMLAAFEASTPAKVRLAVRMVTGE